MKKVYCEETYSYIYFSKVEGGLMVSAPTWNWCYIIKDEEYQYDLIKEDLKSSMLGSVNDNAIDILCSTIIKNIG